MGILQEKVRLCFSLGRHQDFVRILFFPVVLPGHMVKAIQSFERCGRDYDKETAKRYPTPGGIYNVNKTAPLQSTTIAAFKNSPIYHQNPTSMAFFSKTLKNKARRAPKSTLFTFINMVVQRQQAII
ncbi:hypothetical protein [Pontibacter pamirensis]|uniref:hypothetical protein n=1 Tax=Pontibacter pamirensis TaxID=2562824 RepID=UPI00138A304A|nr:hypothetical protein [Pontibacter pamirensis]